MDKRGFERVTVPSLSAAIKTGNIFQLCNVGDLSQGGMFIKSHLKITTNTPVNVIVYGPNRMFHLHAVAVRHNDEGTGFAIDEITPLALQELKNIIDAELEFTDMLETSRVMH